MKKAFRDIKRGVNRTVLSVPRIEQKALDATSNEAWGPHGTLLAEIAQATRNYHDYQMIMAIIWKRIGDSGKNWRHVFKALIVLEHLVANGSERVIDDIREHSYQISMLSEFQYIDSKGRDQGSNIRKKSQSLLSLVNDKEKVVEVREKAAANRDKFHNTSAGGLRSPSSYPNSDGYGDQYEGDRYEGRSRSRDEDQTENGNGREREDNFRDEDRNGRHGDAYGARNGREDGRDGYRDDDYQGRSRSAEDYGPRSLSSDGDKDRAFDYDSQSSSRLEQKLSEQSPGAPPSYEEVVSGTRSPAYSERESLPAHAPGVSPSGPSNSSPPPPNDASPSGGNNTNQASTGLASSVFAGGEVTAFDEFDPRGPVSMTANAAPSSSNGEMDLLGSLADSFVPNPLAVVAVTSDPITSNSDVQANIWGSAFVATPSSSNTVNQPYDNPFGDPPFKVTPTDTESAQQQSSVSASMFSFPASMDNQADAASMFPFSAPMDGQADAPHDGPTKVDSLNNFDFANTFPGTTYAAPNVLHPSTQSQFLPQELPASNQEIDILADILPPSGPSPAVTSQPTFSSSPIQPALSSGGPFGSYDPQAGSTAHVSPSMAPQASRFAGGNLSSLQASTVPASFSSSAIQPSLSSGGPFGNYDPQNGSTAHVSASMAPQASQFAGGNLTSPEASTLPDSFSSSTIQTALSSGGPFGSYDPQAGSTAHVSPSTAPQASQFAGGNLTSPEASPVPDNFTSSEIQPALSSGGPFSSYDPQAGSVAHVSLTMAPQATQFAGGNLSSPEASTVPNGFSSSATQPALSSGGPFSSYDPQAGSTAHVSPSMSPQASLFAGGNVTSQGASTLPENMAHNSFSSSAIQPAQSSGGPFGSYDLQARSTVPPSMAPHPSQHVGGNLSSLGPPTVPETMVHNSFQSPAIQPALSSGGLFGGHDPHAGSTAPITLSFAPESSQFGSGNLSTLEASTVSQNIARNISTGFVPQFNTGSMPPQQGAPFASQNASQVPSGLGQQYNNGSFHPHTSSIVTVSSQTAYQAPTGQTPQLNQANFASQQVSTIPIASQIAFQAPSGPPVQPRSDVLSNMFSQGLSTSMASQPTRTSSGSLSVSTLPSNDKFETKSTVWADTLSRGLVNLNISGPKINPLADIGVDFDAINRKEKRLEKPKPTSSTVTSTVTMGKAMGSGSGIGRVGASARRPTPNSMMGSGMGMGGGMGMGMGGAPTPGFGMGAYGSMNQPAGMGMGMNPGMHMGIGTNMGQGGQTQAPNGYPFGASIPGAYNPMMGAGGYSQQPYGGGYR